MTDKEVEEQPQEQQEAVQEPVQEEAIELEPVNIERRKDTSEKQKRHMEHMRARRAEVQQQKKLEQMLQEKIDATNIAKDDPEPLFGLMEYATVGIALAGLSIYAYNKYRTDDKKPVAAAPTATTSRSTDALFDNF